ncbi:MAG TPA: hydrogenase maturation protease [Actinomycetota bacterium]|nr:hydrogenase maturation protease [Actinomycetota bacterium]
MRPRVLVAGVGNIFLSDDGFGVEVVQRLGARSWPEWVLVKDFGIRGIHLAYELLEGYETVILVDASPRGREPGTVYLIEPELRRGAPSKDVSTSSLMDAHGMEPHSVLALLESLGGQAGRVLVVACEPAKLEDGIGLSPQVNDAVDRAVDLVTELID